MTMWVVKACFPDQGFCVKRAVDGTSAANAAERFYREEVRYTWMADVRYTTTTSSSGNFRRSELENMRKVL